MYPVRFDADLKGWVVQSHPLANHVMRHPELFTVDHAGFTTAAVVGPSMLSLDGEHHTRHRSPFDRPLRNASARRRLRETIDGVAATLTAQMAGQPEPLDLRRQLTGPLAVEVMRDLLQLDATAADLLAWYGAIVAAVTSLSEGQNPDPESREAVLALSERVQDAVGAHPGLLRQAADTLNPEEVNSNAAVLLFGGIETVDGMIANLFWHLLTNTEAYAAVLAEPELLDLAVEESLRLEPAAGRVDRFATAPTRLGNADIGADDLVIVSLRAANRDPSVFSDPSQFTLGRPKATFHLAFARGPHACLASHIARDEAKAAWNAVAEELGELRLLSHDPPSGLVFRKPPRLLVQRA